MKESDQFSEQSQNASGKINIIRIEKQILGENSVYAGNVRRLLKDKNIYCVNLVSSPGAGKTTLLVETLDKIKDDVSCAVIEGDQQTSNDALRISKTGVPVVQVNTLQSCHLNAYQIQKSLDQLPLDDIQLLVIENVGNLICPANMDLGENEKIVLMSVTEGEDKPIKYPLIFSLANVLVLTKTDLLPHLKFDVFACKSYVRSVNHDIQIIETSSFSSSGLSEWIAYIKGNIRN